jgi:hypothetical protein
VTPSTGLALDALARARANLRAARIDAITATAHLSGARALRADELTDKATAALKVCEKILCSW